ncbi:M20 metallopeptidase family protein [Paramaledivibacter caminithermalis]|jgi:amidohydrolase|uniref:Hippurate hydrolase n=1 Tax=Paramaledivibacter caminithermalis (strain DSM 15212 / CIP 107654 / DViRD3) TaxID=1121301 RepID=A0A1M6PZ56_PARC5|nr:N-acetyldiaminopimelate deacetylase [Paramaledivibacter caminithermalis]SHK13275.1 hippurate hydrolase [Paramaledivibacter caminithermalis DSM 15212]
MIIVNKALQDLSEEIIQIRRDLHQIPELGFEEFKTSNYIFKYIDSLDVDFVEKTAGTGVLVYFKGSKGEKTIAFRGDIDGLPINENTDVSYCSLHKGKMHACGHDGHTAILLGLAKYLSMNKSKIKDNILLIFQPAEEGPGGAEVIIKEKVLKKYNVDHIYGLHLYPDIIQGKVGVKSGPMMAQTGEFDIIIRGKSGHGAMPHNAKDSIVIASELVGLIQQIISRNLDPVEPAVITIGKIKGGERRNIIAGKVIMEGTMRAFNDSIYKKMKRKITIIAKSLAMAHDCEIDIIFRDMYPFVNNDKKLVDEFIQAIGRENIEVIKPQMTAEDFSYYQRELSGLFFFLGTKNEDKGFIYSLHNSKFNFDEEVLLIGIQVFINILIHNDTLLM